MPRGTRASDRMAHVSIGRKCSSRFERLRERVTMLLTFLFPLRMRIGGKLKIPAVAFARTVDNPSRLASLNNSALSRANRFTHRQCVHEMAIKFLKST